MLREEEDADVYAMKTIYNLDLDQEFKGELELQKKILTDQKKKEAEEEAKTQDNVDPSEPYEKVSTNQIKHRNIIEYYEIEDIQKGDNQKGVNIFMEFVDGGDLDDLRITQRQKGEPFTD